MRSTLVALGGITIGGASVGFIPVGGLAVSTAYAIGGNGADLEFIRLLEGSFPGFRYEKDSVIARAPARTNLPNKLTSLTGREIASSALSVLLAMTIFYFHGAVIKA